MLLLASAPKHALHRNDLGCSSKLQFKVHAREMGKEQLQLLDVDLSLFVGHNTSAAGPLSNGHQTMVIAGVYTVSVDAACRMLRECIKHQTCEQLQQQQYLV